jgi:RNA polymerase sigma factor (sigma-70 family)
MEDVLTIEQDQRISEAIAREQPRLRNFIRKRVPVEGDVEDILQDVFFELVEAYRLMKPIEQVGSWLFRVARNRITDFFRRKKPQSLGDARSKTCFPRQMPDPRRPTRAACCSKSSTPLWTSFRKISARFSSPTK